MAVSVSNLIESVCNPEHRFKTLRGVVVQTDAAGDPLFLASKTIVSFPVTWQGKSYLLKCSLKRNLVKQQALKLVSAYLREVSSPFLVEYSFLSDEMLVFNDRGQSRHVSVVWMEMPQGLQPIDLLVDEICAQQDVNRMRKLLVEFCKLGTWLINHDIVHGALRPENMLGDPRDCSLRLINYESMQVPLMTTFDETVRNGDNVMVANFAMGLKALVADPSLFRYIKGDSMFRIPIMRSPLLPLFKEVASRSNCVPMIRLVEMLHAHKDILPERKTLSDTLQALLRIRLHWIRML